MEEEGRELKSQKLSPKWITVKGIPLLKSLVPGTTTSPLSPFPSLKRRLLSDTGTRRGYLSSGDEAFSKGHGTVGASSDRKRRESCDEGDQKADLGAIKVPADERSGGHDDEHVEMFHDSFIEFQNKNDGPANEIKRKRSSLPFAKHPIFK